MKQKLEGRAALVTGAGRGIGRAVALKLASEGARVVATDIDGEPLEETVATIGELGGEAVPLIGDVAEPDFGEQAVSEMLDRFGGLDIVVNNAGYIWNTTIQKTSDEQWYAMLDVHLTAPFRILRAAAPFLREINKRERAEGTERHRKVVNVSSISGTHGAATQLAYSSAKAGVVGMTKTLAKEWGRYLVTVNAVAFGLIETRLTQEIPESGATIEVHGRQHKVGLTKQTRRFLEGTNPLGRRGSVADAAGAVYLLCIPESDFVSGQVLECSGGGTI